MTGPKTWWRKLGGLMAICLTAMLLAGPSLEAFICKDDGSVPAASATAEGEVVLIAEHETSDRSDCGPAICQHGHCHHGVQFALTGAEGATALGSRAEIHLPPSQARHDSRSPSGLERPPRA